MFADDVIWGNTKKEVQEKLNIWDNKFQELELKVSKEKMVLMPVGNNVNPVTLKLLETSCL